MWSWEETNTAFTYSSILTRNPQFESFYFLTAFKTEEALLSYLHESYQKTVASGETVLHACAQNMISTIKAFLKSQGTKELEVRARMLLCVTHVIVACGWVWFIR